MPVITYLSMKKKIEESFCGFIFNVESLYVTTKI